MERARMAYEPLPEGVRDIKIIARNWGYERCYKTSSGKEICNKAPFERLYKNK